MNKPYNVYITEEDLLEQKGYSLNTSLRLDHTGDVEYTKIHFLDEIALIIYTKLLDITKDREAAKLVCTDEYFKELITFLQLEQAVYVLENGNVLAVCDDSGQIDIAKLKSNKNALADVVRAELENLLIHNIAIC